MNGVLFKSKINLLISNDNECKICYEEFDKEYHTITCKWCDNSLCLYCYINILKTNNGKHDCPYCKRRISTFHCHTNEEFKDYIGHLVYKNTISDYEKILLDKAKIRDVKKEEKKSANIKCPRCKTYKYEEDFINNKNRILKTCIDCRKRNKKYRDNEKLV